MASSNDSSTRSQGLHFTFHTYTHFKKYLNQDQIIQYNQDGHLFGFVEYDIVVPVHLKDCFLSEMTPIFKNTEVSLKDHNQHMQQYAKEHSINPIQDGVFYYHIGWEQLGMMIPWTKSL